MTAATDVLGLVRAYLFEADGGARDDARKALADAFEEAGDRESAGRLRNRTVPVHYVPGDGDDVETVLDSNIDGWKTREEALEALIECENFHTRSEAEAFAAGMQVVASYTTCQIDTREELAGWLNEGWLDEYEWEGEGADADEAKESASQATLEEGLVGGGGGDVEEDDRLCADCLHRGDDHDDLGVCRLPFCKCQGWEEADDEEDLTS